VENELTDKRKGHELPMATDKWGWRYHHLGIPTDTQLPGERYLEALKMYVSGFETSPFGIEWMRFEADSPVSELVKKVPHIAFEVEDLDAALVGKEILSNPCPLTDGVRVAMIIDNNTPIELLEFGTNKYEKGCGE
jgi:hypothetical protein